MTSGATGIRHDRREIGGGIVERLLQRTHAHSLDAAENRNWLRRAPPWRRDRRRSPPAPPTFSITTCWPRSSESRGARMRPMASDRAAGGERRNHHGHRPGRPILRARGSRRTRAAARARRRSMLAWFPAGHSSAAPLALMAAAHLSMTTCCHSPANGGPAPPPSAPCCAAAPARTRCPWRQPPRRGIYDHQQHRQEECVPGGDINGKKFCSCALATPAGSANAPAQDRDRLDLAARDLSGRRSTKRARIVDAAGHHVRHRRPVPR